MMKKFTCQMLVGLAGVFSGLSPTLATAEIPQMEGLLVASSDNTRTGWWQLPVEEGGQWNSLIEINPGYATFYSGIRKDNVYYTTRANAQYGTTIVYLDAYDAANGEKIWTNYPDLSLLAYDQTYNPHDGRIYGIFSNHSATGLVLATVEYANQDNRLNVIRELEGTWVAIAAAPNGDLYAISSDAQVTSGIIPEVNHSWLYKVDPLSGDMTLIGETGQKPVYSGSATIDKRSGRMFWTVGPADGSSYLCEVDLQTGQASKIFDFEGNRQIVGLYAPTPEAEEDAPAQVNNLQALFEGGSLEGAISFTAPDKLFNGADATGTLTYTIMTNGEILSQGEVMCGQNVSAPVTMPGRGRYTFLVSVANAAGESPKASIEYFVGFGTPVAPANVLATKENQNVVITWDEVGTSTDGGYINSTEVRYNIFRMPDNMVIATGVAGNSYETLLPESENITSFFYNVVADNHGILSSEGSSNPVVAGNITLPWQETFDNEESLNLFTIIDANEDNKTWSWYLDRVRVIYNSGLEMDDWLVTPGLQLNAGNSYAVSLKARSSSGAYPERLEVKWGTAPTSESMTNMLIEPVTLSEEYTLLTGTIEPTADGLYYIGIHGISEKDKYYLEVDDLLVEAGISNATPAAPADFNVTPDPDGEYKASISLRAPECYMDGQPLSAIDRIEIKRAEEVIKTFTNPTPGELLSFEDVVETGGNITYSARAFNENGGGEEAVTTIFIGTPIAAAPETLTVTENTPGNVTLTWTAVTQSAAGTPIPSDRVKYNIYNVYSEPVLIGENIEGTEYTFEGAQNGSQQFARYAVAPVTDGGEGNMAETRIVSIGTPYSRFIESYPGGEATYEYRTERLNYGNWEVINDTENEIKAQDNDGGYIVMNGYFAGYCGALITGKISLQNIAAPVLRFYTYTPDNMEQDLNTIAVSVSQNNGAWSEVFKKNITEIGATAGWHEVIIPLSDYAGSDIAMRFIATTTDRPYVTTYLDNLSVVSMAGIDIEVAELEAPLNVRAGDEFGIKVKVVNHGATAADDAVLSILEEDNEIARIDLDPIASLGRIEIQVPLTMSALAENPIAYKAVVSHPEDTNMVNNESEVRMVSPVQTLYPAPENLTAESHTSGIALSWEAPATGEPGSQITADFELAEGWAHSVKGWAFVDADQAPVCAFGEMEVPGITAGKTSASFFVFNTSDQFNGNIYLMPHSGDQYIAAFARYDDGTTNDWAISPELSRNAQTISFYARSYHASYPEKIEVYYSTGSLDISDFILLDDSAKQVPGEWTRYEVSLPEGAVRFAIRSCATAAFMLMLDDFSYEPAECGGLNLIGYNIYCDNVKVNETPIENTSFTATVNDEDSHSWIATALYSEGESGCSNTVVTNFSGIDTEYGNKVSISAGEGFILATGVEGLPVMIAAADGKVVYNTASATSILRIEVVPGIYIVKAGTVSGRLLVH